MKATPPRTSLTHPIRVDPLLTDVGPGRGRLGITFAPGKRGPSAFGAPWARDLAVDLDALRGDYAVDLLVSLVEDHELHAFGIPHFVAEAERRGIAVLRVPVVDGAAPTFDQAAWASAVAVTLASSGRHVVFHCRGGLGRAGTFAACTLVRLGRGAEEAVVETRRARPGAIESASQELFVSAFAARLPR